MTLTKEAEALLGDLADIQETRYDVAFRWVSDALERIIAAVRAEQAAEVERLRAVVKRTASMGLCSRTGHEHLMAAARAALAAAPAVAPDPAPPAPDERCEDCAGNFVDGYCRRHEPSFHGYNGAVSVPEPAP